MLIKNGRMIVDRILKPLKIRIRSAPAAVLLGSCALLFGSQLCAQDLLLKEYIYLDGKLLAVERQVLTQAAQQPANDSGTERVFAQNTPSGIHKLTPPGSYCNPGISGISCIEEMRTFHIPVLAKFLCPEKGSRLEGGEDLNLQYGAYGWRWKMPENSEHENGGTYDGL